MTTLNSSFDLIADLNVGSYGVAPTKQKPATSISVMAWWTPGRQLALMWSCVFIIASVSMYDVYWSFKTQLVLAETEQNPIGSWLINMDNGDIALFMTVKMMGTMGVILAVPALFFFRRSWGVATSLSLATFQMCLFAYLNFGHCLHA